MKNASLHTFIPKNVVKKLVFYVYIYILHNHNFLTDINECNNNSTCDHRCINTIGSFICECDSGYQLNDDLMTCSGM